jgi:aerobic-type carbon monoxide dehydrogenase small subunit (CoxS/CutS family)
MSSIILNINGKRAQVDTDADRSLLEVLRDELNLTASKYGCGEGQCGACTVIIDGRATRSCITEVGSVSGKKITTLEGVAASGKLHPVQQAFIDATAMQCGYCTSGMIMSAVALLASNSDPGDSDIIRGMQGNICRCCTYPRIIAAVRSAAKMMKAPTREAKGGAR